MKISKYPAYSIIFLLISPHDNLWEEVSAVPNAAVRLLSSEIVSFWRAAVQRRSLVVTGYQ